MEIKVPPKHIPSTGDDSPVSGIWQYTWRMTGRHQIALGFIAVVIAALNLAPIEIQRRMVDDALTGRDHGLLVRLAILYCTLLVFHQALKFAMRLYQNWLGESSVLYTRRHLIGLHSERAEEERPEVGKAISIIGTEVDKLGQFVGEAPSDACVNLAKLLGVVGYMAYVQPEIAAVALLLLMPQVAIVPLMQKRLNELIEIRLRKLRELGDAVAQGEAADKTELTHSIYRNHMAFFAWKFLMKSAINLANGLAPIAILLWGGWLVIEGQTTVGVIVAFLSGTEKISGPIRDLLGFYRIVAQAQVQHEMIARWI